MNLAFATQQQFGSVMCDFWQNENGDIFMTINQLAEALEYADRSGVQKIVNRNEYLKDIEFSTEDKLSLVEGGRKVERDVRIFTEDGIYEVTMLSKQPKAREFRAFVRKTLRALRKGEAILVQPQSDHDKIQIQKMRAEAMLLNARTRQAKLILDMQKNKMLSPVAVELLQVNALEKIIDQQIEHRPRIGERHYSATEIGEMLGVSKSKIGRLANKHNLKTEEYGMWVLDKSPYSNKQVNTFRYNEKGIDKLKEILGGRSNE